MRVEAQLPALRWGIPPSAPRDAEAAAPPRQATPPPARVEAAAEAWRRLPPRPGPGAAGAALYAETAALVERQRLEDLLGLDAYA